MEAGLSGEDGSDWLGEMLSDDVAMDLVMGGRWRVRACKYVKLVDVDIRGQTIYDLHMI